jgi:MFS superfamily sulfate permease-like transporter
LNRYVGFAPPAVIQGLDVFCLLAQLVPMLGLTHLLKDAHTQTPINKLIFLVQHVSATNPYTAIMSAVSLTCLIGAKITKRLFGGKIRALKYFPEIFIIVAVATGMYCTFKACCPVTKLLHRQSLPPSSDSIKKV